MYLLYVSQFCPWWVIGMSLRQHVYGDWLPNLAVILRQHVRNLINIIKEARFNNFILGKTLHNLCRSTLADTKLLVSAWCCTSTLRTVQIGVLDHAVLSSASGYVTRKRVSMIKMINPVEAAQPKPSCTRWPSDFSACASAMPD